MLRLKSPLTIIAMTIALAGTLALSGCTGNDGAQKPVLTKQVAEEGVKRLNPEIVVISVNPGPVDGLWELVVKKDTAMSVAYMDAEGKLMFLGTVVDTLKKVSLTELRLNELLTIDPAELPTDGTILLGKKDAPIVMYVFSDPECEYCALLHGEMLNVVALRDDIAFQIVLVPIIKKHPAAYATSKTIMCAESDKEALKLLESAYVGDKLPPVPCESTVVEDNLNFLDKYSIAGTPTIIFPDGTRFQGAVRADELIAMAESAAGIAGIKEQQPQEGK